METIAMYLRLSDEDTKKDALRESNSIAHQRSLIMDYISSRQEFKEYQIVEYADDGYSGMDFSRPGFREMMKQVTAGNIRTVITKDYSRLGRDYLEVGNYMEITFPMLGVRYISVNDGYDSRENNGATGGMEVVLKNIVNAIYCKDASKKVRAAKKVLAEQGRYYASFAPFGYRKSPEDKYRLEPDPDAAPVVRLIFEMAAEGKKYTEIAEILNEQGYDTIMEYYDKTRQKRSHSRDFGKRIWSATSVMNILYNEVYLGKVVNNKVSYNIETGHRTVKNDLSERIVVENCHEPLVSQELFDLAHEKLGRKEQKARPKGKGWNRGLIICGICGKAMRKDRRRYRCMKKHLVIMAEPMEDSILSLIRANAEAALQRLEYFNRSIEAEDTEMEIKTLKNRLAGLSKQKFLVYDDYTNGKLERAVMAEKTAALNSDIESLQQMISDKEAFLLQTKQDDLKEKEDQMEILCRLEHFEKEKIRMILKEITVYSQERIEVVWNTDDFYMGTDNEKEAGQDGEHDKNHK